MKKLLLFILFLSFTLFAGVIREGSLKALSDGNNITVQWGSADEGTVVEYHVERCAGMTGEFSIIASVQPKGTNSSYEYIDRTAFKTDASIYQYRIKILKRDSEFEYSKNITVSHNVSGVKRTWGSLKAMFR